MTRSWLAVGLALALSVQPAAALAGSVRSCVIDQIDGQSARYWGSGGWSDLKLGFVLPAEAKIQTGGDTRVRIVCDDDTILTVGTETELNLEDLASATASRQPVAMQLIEGIIGLILSQRDKVGLEVRTPVAIASVRSTEWLVEWHPDDAAAVFVWRGKVLVREPRGQRSLLGDGEGITISAGDVAGEVKVWGEARIAKSTGQLGFDWQ